MDIETNGAATQSIDVTELPFQWGEIAAEDGLFYEWKCPTMQFWLRRKKRTVAVTHEYLSLDDDLGEVDDTKELEETLFLPDEKNWDYRVLEKAPKKIRFQPVLPDKPILFNLCSPVNLLPGANTSVYIKLRSWIKVSDVASQDWSIKEFPSVQPEKAWFGATTTSGEVCYWRKETASLTPDFTELESHLILCPITVYNRSEQQLVLSTMYLRASALSIFQAEEGLVTDRVQVFYSGDKQISEVKVSGKAPPFAPSAKLVSNPREPAGRLQSAMAGAWNLLTRMAMLGDDD